MTGYTRNQPAYAINLPGCNFTPHRFALAATAVRGIDTLYYVLNDSLHNDFVILAAPAGNTGNNILVKGMPWIPEIAGRSLPEAQHS